LAWFPWASGLSRANPAGATFHTTWQAGCATPPAQALAAFETATGIWGSLISSPVPIEVSACWTSTPPCAGIACGEPSAHLRNFSQALFIDTYYPIALANALSGDDLAPMSEDIDVWFDANQAWSFASGSTLVEGPDFISVALHELAHGLGFVGNLYESYNVGFCGNGPYYWFPPCPTPYDRFAVDSLGVPLLSYLVTDPITLAARLKGDARFGGANTLAKNGAAAILYTPAIWDQGSSFSHLDPGTFGSDPNRLMLPTYQDNVRHPGPVALAMLQDLGWSLAGESANLTTAGPQAAGVGSAAAFTADLSWPAYGDQDMTYTWTATDQAPITHTARGLSDTLALTWNSPGLKSLSVTATGGDVSAGATRSVLVFGLLVSGPSQGDPHQAYSFQSALLPDDTALPVTYQWQATGQATVTHPDQGVTDAQIFTWTAPGLKTIRITASIGGASTLAVFTIQIAGQALDNPLYLPLITGR
jgi:hypothetical protein